MDFVPDFTFAHIGVNLNSSEEAEQNAELFANLFSIPRNPDKESKDASYSGTQIEWLKKTGKGTHGHIALGTHDLPGAMTYLEKKGLRWDKSTIKYDDSGKILVIMSVQEIGGFAIQLMQL